HRARHARRPDGARPRSARGMDRSRGTLFHDSRRGRLRSHRRPLEGIAVSARTTTPIASDTRIGHVHLKVSDLERSLKFYRDVLGFELVQRMGDQAASLSAGGYHPPLGLNTWESKGGPPPPPGTTGLFHTAILYSTRAALADALRRLID